jgi:hypothetical protein
MGYQRSRFVVDNVEIAILTKVNELAERYGIKPYRFCAVVHMNDNPTNITLQFEVPFPGDSAKAKDFDKMLDLIGFGKDTHSLVGSDEKIIDALDDALRRAPRQRPRT